MTVRVSLITPSFNGARFLRAALESVRRQSTPPFEHLIMDACSTDGTAAIVQDFPHVTLISEPDRGSHDAMNKGLARARGDIVGYLNTDDVLSADALALVTAAFDADPTLGAVYGGTAFFTGAERDWRLAHIIRAPAAADLDAALLYLATNFNAWFFRRDLLLKHGGFDEAYDYSADRALLTRFAAQERTLALPDLIYAYRMHGGSRTMADDSRTIVLWLREHLHLAARQSAAARTDEEKRAARQFAAFEHARIALHTLRAGDAIGAIGGALAHWTRQPAWPFDAMGAVRRRRALYGAYLDRAPHADAVRRFVLD